MLMYMCVTHECYMCTYMFISQVDEASLRDVCAEYGLLQKCLVNVSPAIQCALICYSTQEEAVMAKAGLDRNPSICGISVVADFATEQEVGLFGEKWSRGDGSNALKEATPSWFTEPVPSHHQVNNLPPHPHPHTPSQQQQWESASAPPGGPSGSSAGTPTSKLVSSMWGDGNFLGGISSPWHMHTNSGSSSATTSGGGGGVSGSASVSAVHQVPQQRQGGALGHGPGGEDPMAGLPLLGASPISTYLPNGLL